MQGLPLFWIELKRTGEGQGVIPHGAGVCVGGLDRVAVFAGSHGNDVIRASGPVAAPIRSSWRVPMSNAGGAGCGKKNGPNRVGPMSAAGRFSPHVLERLQPRAPFTRAREATLTGVHTAPHGAGMLFPRLPGHSTGLRLPPWAGWPHGGA